MIKEKKAISRDEKGCNYATICDLAEFSHLVMDSVKRLDDQDNEHGVMLQALSVQLMKLEDRLNAIVGSSFANK
jgi:hypothetical protein